MENLDEISLFLQSHVMSIKWRAFCTLKDKIDGQNKKLFILSKLPFKIQIIILMLSRQS